MCGRYYVEISKDELSFINNIDSFNYSKNYNISPQSEVPSVIDNNLVLTKWGYLPDWLKKQNNPRPLFNTRVESLLEKKTFTSAFKNSRCLMPITGWYEWTEENDTKQPYFFFNQTRKIMFAAGLFWKRSSGVIETSIITREAYDPLSTIHSRTPLILSDAAIETWLSNRDILEVYENVKELKVPTITFHKVDKAVNNPRNNNESLINQYQDIPF